MWVCNRVCAAQWRACNFFRLYIPYMPSWQSVLNRLRKKEWEELKKYDFCWPRIPFEIELGPGNKYPGFDGQHPCWWLSVLLFAFEWIDLWVGFLMFKNYIQALMLIVEKVFQKKKNSGWFFKNQYAWGFFWFQFAGHSRKKDQKQKKSCNPFTE